MRRIMLLLAIFGLAGSLWAADPLIGTWKTNIEKSSFPANQQGIKEDINTYREIEGDLIELSIRTIQPDGSLYTAKWTWPKQGGFAKCLSRTLDEGVIYVQTLIEPGHWCVCHRAHPGLCHGACCDTTVSLPALRTNAGPGRRRERERHLLSHPLLRLVAAAMHWRSCCRSDRGVVDRLAQTRPPVPATVPIPRTVRLGPSAATASWVRSRCEAQRAGRVRIEAPPPESTGHGTQRGRTAAVGLLLRRAATLWHVSATSFSGCRGRP